METKEVTREETLEAILFNLNRVLDAYWNGKRDDNQIRLITFWQQKSAEILNK